MIRSKLGMGRLSRAGNVEFLKCKIQAKSFFIPYDIRICEYPDNSSTQPQHLFH